MTHSHIFKVTLLVSVLCLGLPDVQAQYGLGTSELSPEKSLSAWKMQSRSVAQDLGLSQQKATLLEPAYTNARASHQEAARKLEEQIDDRGERYEALLKSQPIKMITSQAKPYPSQVKDSGASSR